MVKKEVILNYVMQVLITIIGTIGIINTVVTSEFQYMDSKAGLYTAIIFASIIFAALFRIKKYRRYILGGTIIIVAAIAFTAYSDLENGIICIINDFISYVGEEKGINISGYKIPVMDMSEEMHRHAVSYATTVIGVVIAYIVSINVTVVKSMFYGIANIFPFMFLMISYNIMPTAGSILLCFLYVMCTAAMKRDSNKIMPALIIMAVTIMVYGLAVLAVSGDNYSKPKFFAAVNDFIETRFSNSKNWLFKGTEKEEGEDGDSNGGSANGRVMPSGQELGTFDKLEYENRTLAYLTTQLTGSRQYIPTYYGRVYHYKENMWSNEKKSEENHNVNREFFMMLEGNNTNYKSVADTKEDYNKLVEIYAYNYREVNSNNTSGIEFGYNVDSSVINRLSHIGKGDYVLSEPNNNMNMHQQEFSEYERNQYYSARNIWLNVDTNVNYQLNDLIDIPNSCSTSEEVLNYVRYVRQYLASNYEYTLEPGRVPEDSDFVTYFLTNSKKGYCVHFASSAVLMFRAAGIPARYVEGFVLTPEQIEQGEKSVSDDKWYKEVNSIGGSSEVTNYTVEVKDTASHAWVEIYLTGYGWLPVEVTPAYSGAGIMGTNDEDTGASEGESQQNESESQTETDSNSEQEESTNDSSEQETVSGDNNLENENGGAGIFTGIIDFVKKFWAAILAVIIAAAVVLLFIARYNSRKRRLNKILRENLIGSYEILEKLLRFTGYRRPDNMTYEMYAEYLKGAEKIFAEYDIVYITEMTLKMQLSGNLQAVSEDEQRKLCSDIRAIREEVIKKMPLLKRLQIKYFVVL